MGERAPGPRPRPRHACLRKRLPGLSGCARVPSAASYFNYRSTKFLAEHGPIEFWNWFDAGTWYPLGRIVGFTVYPGIMWTAALEYWASAHTPAARLPVALGCLYRFWVPPVWWGVAMTRADQALAHDRRSTT